MVEYLTLMIATMVLLYNYFTVIYRIIQILTSNYIYFEKYNNNVIKIRDLVKEIRFGVLEIIKCNKILVIIIATILLVINYY